MVVGAFTGWLAVYRGRERCGRRARRRARPAPALGLLHAILTVPLGIVAARVRTRRHAVRRRASRRTRYRVTLPQVTTPPTIEPFARDELASACRCSTAQTPLTLLALVLRAAARVRPQSHAGWGSPCAWSARIRARPKARASTSIAVRIGDGRRRVGADGRRRRVPHAVGVQRVLLQHGQRPRLDLRGARRVRVVAPGQGAARGAAVRGRSTRCSCACSRRAARTAAATRST